MPEKRSCQEASIRPVYRRRPHAIVAGAKQEPAMSTPPEASPAKPAKPSAASRYLFVFLVGLVIGAVALVMILRPVAARKTWQEHYPRSEERRVGKECVRKCKSRCPPYHQKKK